MSALAGIRVIDFGQWIAGPQAALLLADQGADVVHVDPPDGPRWQSPANATLMRGKRCLRLDLKSDRDADFARRLVEFADVLIENFRPGVMDRLGLGAAASLAANPRLVYCSLPGFASDDPRAAMPAWDGVVSAATGVHWQPQVAAGEPPRSTPLTLPSSFAALNAAVAVTMALIARERDGLGQRVEVPLFDSMFAAIGANGLLVDGRPQGRRPDDPWVGLFPAADGRLLRINLTTFKFLTSFVEATGRSDWLEKGYVERERPGRLAQGTELRERQRREFEELFRSRTAAEWEELANRADVPITPVRSGEEWLRTEHARTAGLVTALDDAELGSLVVPAPPVQLQDTPAAAGSRQAVDAGGDQLLAEWRRHPQQPSPRPPARLERALAGFRVVDVTQVLAGPTCARTLAEYGAEVVKINNPWEEGPGYRWSRHRYHTDVNRGKATVLVDLKTQGGLDVFWRLADRADVVLQNFRRGVADRLGIGYAQVKARNPNVVYGSISFYGYGGPWESLPGYEPNAQAATGITARSGGVGQPYAICDYSTGLLGAFAVGLALFQRQRGGGGQAVHTSLAAAGTYLQLPFLSLRQDPTSVEAPAPPRRPDLLQRHYRTRDGWLYVGAKASQLPDLSRLLGLSIPADASESALVASVEEAFAGRESADWARVLMANGIGAAAVVAPTALMLDPWVVRHGLSVTRQHPGGEEITTTGPTARLSRTPPVPGRPVSLPGGDAEEVLGQIGLADRLDDLVASRALVLE